jgi:hypothetical protein
MDSEDKVFFEVELNGTEPTACSPADPGPAWRGIVIRAPKQIPVDSAKFPLCGFYNVDMASLEDGRPLTVRAVDTASGKMYGGFIQDSDESPEDPPPARPPRDPSLLEGMAVGGYFNPNLYDYFEMPRIAATYEVQVQFGGLLSNAVIVQVTP